MTARDLNPRVKAFCDWLDTLPAGVKFVDHPSFRFFADLSDEQIDSAMHEMRRRGADALAEAAKLNVERERRKSADHLAAIETTTEQDMAIEIVIRDALSVCPDVTDAAELLMGAAFTILFRNYAPKAALSIFDKIAAAGREAAIEAIQ